MSFIGIITSLRGGIVHISPTLDVIWSLATLMEILLFLRKGSPITPSPLIGKSLVTTWNSVSIFCSLLVSVSVVDPNVLTSWFVIPIMCWAFDVLTITSSFKVFIFIKFRSAPVSASRLAWPVLHYGILHIAYLFSSFAEKIKIFDVGRSLSTRELDGRPLRLFACCFPRSLVRRLWLSLYRHFSFWNNLLSDVHPSGSTSN